ncbi:hypothetical protein IP91_04061 [Pseudoduganella lurida]|uniref:Conjugal transfer protein TraK n=1 Tax=Pseudoduganella lurida TaxID=1036180 RepID=A0A562R0G1_9BURK|nr:TraK family protein [Pseudoduganella lurida]TWI62541.1 hypothetical protein IP91_04061 [Pseudoduganella lurida]
MVKNYPEELANWVRKKPTTRRDRNLAAFLAVRSDVLAGLQAGYQAKTVWRNLIDEGRVAFGYGTFLRYVKMLPESATPTLVAPPLGDPKTVAAGAEPIRETAQLKPGQQAGFVFNPVPRKEDLL